ncbi:hypothetical protein D3C84_974940 [compost metagenome]
MERQPAIECTVPHAMEPEVLDQGIHVGLQLRDTLERTQTATVIRAELQHTWGSHGDVDGIRCVFWQTVRHADYPEPFDPHQPGVVPANTLIRAGGFHAQEVDLTFAQPRFVGHTQVLH